MAAASAPVPVRERVEWIDALRGFALLPFRTRSSDRTVPGWALGMLIL